MPQQSSMGNDDAGVPLSPGISVGHLGGRARSSPFVEAGGRTVWLKLSSWGVQALVLWLMGTVCGASLSTLTLDNFWSTLGFVLTALATQLLAFLVPMLVSEGSPLLSSVGSNAEWRLLSDATLILLAVSIVGFLRLPFTPELPAILGLVRLFVGCSHWTRMAAHPAEGLQIDFTRRSAVQRFQPSVPSLGRWQVAILGLAVVWGLWWARMAPAFGETWAFRSISLTVAVLACIGMHRDRTSHAAGRKPTATAIPDWLAVHLLALGGVVSTHCYSIFLGVPFPIGDYALLASLAGMAITGRVLVGDTRPETEEVSGRTMSGGGTPLPAVKIYNASLGLVVYALLAWTVLQLLPVVSFDN